MIPNLHARRLLRAAALLVCIVAPRVDAQAADRLVGVYDEETGAALADVQLILLGTGREWRTTATGAAVLRDLPSGDHVLRVRRLGYAPHSEFLTLSPRDSAPLTLVLRPLPVLLPEVVVRARETLYERRLSGFLERRRSSVAPASSFISEQDLRTWGAVRWTDALARTSGVHSSASGAISLRGCGRLSVFLDGQLLASNDLSAIALPMVAAIEVYRGAAQIPAEFNVTARACGALVVWTK